VKDRKQGVKRKIRKKCGGGIKTRGRIENKG
jgi:hypothetical protein